MLWIRSGIENPSKSEVIGRCGKKNEWPHRTDKSRTLKKQPNIGLVTASSDDAVKDIKLHFLSLFSVKYVFFILRMLFLFLSMFSIIYFTTMYLLSQCHPFCSMHIRLQLRHPRVFVLHFNLLQLNIILSFNTTAEHFMTYHTYIRSD